MNLKQFKYVLVLADEESFSKAAAKLNISQPSLSQYVRKIEEELDIELFDRTGGNVRLTDAGRAYINAGKKILNIEHQMQNEFLDIKSNKAGTYIIGVSPYRSICIMPGALARFAEKYPGIQIILDERVGQELIDRAVHGEYDLCITTLPVDTQIFTYDEIMKEELVLAVPAKDNLNKKLSARAIKDKQHSFPVIDINLINNESFVMLSETQQMQQALNRICTNYSLSLTKVMECRSLEATKAMVEAGIGCAILPSSLFIEEDTRVKCYSFTQETLTRDIVAITRKENIRTKITEDMIEMLKAGSSIERE